MPDHGPSAGQIVAHMREAMGEIPAAIVKSLDADPTMIFEQAHSSAFAMPPENGALDPETRTLVYLAVALASSNQACTLAMLNKSRKQAIPTPKLLEAFHIARFAQATQVVGNAEPLFDFINERGVNAEPGKDTR